MLETKSALCLVALLMLLSAGPSWSASDAEVVCVKGALDAAKGTLKTRDEIVRACGDYGKAIRESVAKAACPDLNTTEARWRTIAKSPVTDLGYRELTFHLNVAAARRALECNNGGLLFGALLTRDQYQDTRDGIKLLERATADGKDTIGDLDAMVAQQLTSAPADPFPGKRGFVVPATYRMFRDTYRKDTPVNCAALEGGMAAADKRMTGMILGELLHVAAQGRCAGAVPFAERSLQDSIPSVRRMGCIFLGEAGTATNLKAVERIASTDGHTETRGRNTVYPVRDACLAASGKIKLRSP